jgi:tRNA threonylcarbamoyladenosine biosynthesis protein TsaE
MTVNFTLLEIDQIAKDFLSTNKERKVIAFHGEMGAGKTTFIHALCKAMQVTSVVSSPTFSVINEYNTVTGDIVYHMDLYRLKDEADAMSTGIEECLYSGNVCLVEWPEKAPGILPDDTLHVFITLIGGDERKISW